MTHRDPIPTPLLVTDGEGRETAVTLVRRGDIDDETVAYALKRFENVAAHVHEPILFARLVLGPTAEPDRWLPSEAQVALDVNGDVVRAEARMETMIEAVDLAVDRLREQLRHRHDRRLARRKEPA